ncbi:MAG TPA: hypothetical protein VN722_12105 [Hanamia sp.]|nr:hypothetical protein [Hanamia sp.]
MTAFKDLGIEPTVKGFVGDKIKVHKILKKDITVLDWKLDESKYKERGSGKCLVLQIILDEEKRVVFTGSIYLIDIIKLIPKDKFPITTIIDEKDGRYVFT